MDAVEKRSYGNMKTFVERKTLERVGPARPHPQTYFDSAEWAHGNKETVRMSPPTATIVVPKRKRKDSFLVEEADVPSSL